ncbi:MAG: hypothetical protein IM638_05025 [Bacteroidetes bacterium]|nr:hypothetical protein [Bacteroidota bacterium]
MKQLFFFLGIIVFVARLQAQCQITPVIVQTGMILCPNTSDSLTLTQSYDSYQWYQNGTPMPGETSAVLYVHYSTNAGFQYSVFVTDDTCSGFSQPVLVDGWIFQYPLVSTSRPDSICNGELNIVSLDLPWIALQWKLNGVPIPNSNNNTIIASQTGFYEVDAYPGYCTTSVQTPAMSITLTFVGPPVPVISYVNGQLQITPPPGTYVQWNIGAVPIAGATGNTFIPSGNGQYTVTVTDSNGCSSTSQPYSWITGINEVSSDSEIKLVSAIDGAFVFSFSPQGVSRVLRFYDVTGRLVGTEILPSGAVRASVGLQHFPPGLYLFVIEDSNGTHSAVRAVR